MILINLAILTNDIQFRIYVKNINLFRNVDFYDHPISLSDYDVIVIDAETVRISEADLLLYKIPVILLSNGIISNEFGNNIYVLPKISKNYYLLVLEINIVINNILSKNRCEKKTVAIASSTGGTDALEIILKEMPADSPPILIVQHIISGFTKRLAERLDSICKMQVREAKTGDIVKDGLALIAPSDFHMKVEKRNNLIYTNCFESNKIHGVIPAADVLFLSMAECCGKNAIAVVLTGMGVDGAEGTFRMHNNGAKTICQDKETSVVYGMPRAAKSLGAIDYELPINEIAKKILYLSDTKNFC